MSALGDPFTRWRDRQTGEILVAIAAKDDGEGVIVLPVRHRCEPHILDWMPQAEFLRRYERAESERERLAA